MKLSQMMERVVCRISCIDLGKSISLHKHRDKPRMSVCWKQSQHTRKQTNPWEMEGDVSEAAHFLVWRVPAVTKIVLRTLLI